MNPLFKTNGTCLRCGRGCEDLASVRLRVVTTSYVVGACRFCLEEALVLVRSRIKPRKSEPRKPAPPKTEFEAMFPFPDLPSGSPGSPDIADPG